MGVSLLLVPDGVGVGLEVNRTARVFPSFQNMNNGIGVPVVRISGFRTWGVNAFSPLIGGRIEHLFRLQEFGDLHRPPAFHTQIEDALDHRSGCFVHDPLCSILRVFAVAKGDIGCQRDALLALGLLYRTDFAAGVLGKKLISSLRIKHDKFKLRCTRQNCSRCGCPVPRSHPPYISH